MTTGQKRPAPPRKASDLSVAVIGAGLMGHSIAGVFASTGAKVAIQEPTPPR